MRELERNSLTDDPSCPSLAIIGQGRVGTALAAALEQAGYAVDGPLGRGADAAGATAVLLCVPDGEIKNAAASIAPGPLVGHCSGATKLDALAPHEAFSLHPLMTVAADGATFDGAGGAIAGTTPRALAFAHELVDALGMRAVEIADEDRTAYHAAASIASNFLITLEAAAERLGATAGIDRELLAPLVRAAVENWSTLGPERALTGPVARGDEVTVAAQREAIAERAEELLPLFDALVEATRALANTTVGGGAARMRTVRKLDELHAALGPARRDGRSIGLVPTMGALHEGHLSLIRRARSECDVVVVSLFVNPAQFSEASDLDAYPRNEVRDAQLAADAGADYLFAPRIGDVYPRGFATTVAVARVTEPLEGEHRGRGHFDGVTTVVAKLLNMVGPDVAYFGQKDAQQVAVIKRLVHDLDFPVTIAVCETVREPDGLALSSRNVRLSPAERERATALNRALRTASEAIAAGERDPLAVVSAARADMTSTNGVELEYLELVDPQTFVPIQRVEPGELLAVVAARVGTTRLIDNQPIHVPSTPAADRESQRAGSNDTQEALECSARC